MLMLVLLCPMRMTEQGSCRPRLAASSASARRSAHSDERGDAIGGSEIATRIPNAAHRERPDVRQHFFLVQRGGAHARRDANDAFGRERITAAFQQRFRVRL